MPLTRYHFANAVNAFYEMSTDAARGLLPPHLEPLEVRHGSGVFAITAFDFTESEVGAYQEIVLAVIAPPLVKPGGEFPKSAFYPFLLGTSTRESRAHAIERWHLPHYMKNVVVDFERSGEQVAIHVHEDSKPILDFTISEHNWTNVNHLYQCFMINDNDKFKVDIHMEGSFSEHEEESGNIEIHDHPMSEKLRDAEDRFLSLPRALDEGWPFKLSRSWKKSDPAFGPSNLTRVIL